MYHGSVQIVQSGPFEGRISPGKARWFDNCDFQAEAGGHADNGCGIGGNVGLEEGNFDHDSGVLANVAGMSKAAQRCDNSWLDNFRGQCQNRQSLRAKGLCLTGAGGQHEGT